MISQLGGGDHFGSHVLFIPGLPFVVVRTRQHPAIIHDARERQRQQRHPLRHLTPWQSSHARMRGPRRGLAGISVAFVPKTKVSPVASLADIYICLADIYSRRQARRITAQAAGQNT